MQQIRNRDVAAWPDRADRGLYIGSERSFDRVLHAHCQAQGSGRARPPQEPRPVPRLVPEGRIRSGAGKSLICPPASVESSCISIW